MDGGKHYHSTVQHAPELLPYQMTAFQAHWNDSTGRIFSKKDDNLCAVASNLMFVLAVHSPHSKTTSKINKHCYASVSHPDTR
jgi:hypothetical protein